MVDSDSEDDVKRVVKSAKDKQMDEVIELSRAILKAMGADEWHSVSGDFDKVNKVVPKLVKSLKGQPLPRSYIRALAGLEDAVEKPKSKADLKKLNAVDARALNQLKQRVRKHNKSYAKQIAEFKANPEKAQKKVQASQQRAAAIAAGPQDDDEEEDDGFTTVGKGGKKAQGPTYTAETLNKHLRAVIEARGRKNTDKEESIRILETLYKVSANAVQQVKVLMAMVSARFDAAPVVSGYMSIPAWAKAQEHLNQLLEVLEANPQIRVFETAELQDEESDMGYKGEPIELRGSIIAFVDRLDDEFTKSLQNIDPHTTDYVDRMRDDVPLYTTIVRAQLYFERASVMDSQCRIVLRRLEHLYYRTDQVNARVEAVTLEALPKGINESKILPSAVVSDMADGTHMLCAFLYQNAEPLLRTRAMLMHIFNHALHKRYYVARDLLLMSHLQENVQQADVNTQVLYNRALAQLGMAAFRIGKIQEAFQHTQELISSGRQRELLAQGMSQQRMQQLSPEQEQLEKQRQLPFHININLELLECVFLTSSMLLEIPHMASANTNADARRSAISRVFRRMLDFNERQVFLGPPENTRDHIMAASKALAEGDWESARDLINDIKIWSLLPEAEEIKKMLASKIQIEALRTYLFTYSTQFESIGIQDLATMFGLGSPKVYSLLARMVYNEELAASLDEVSGVLIFNPANFEASSRLQQTALALSSKAGAFADINERVFELKIGGGMTANERDQRNNEGGQRDRDGRQGQQRGGKDGQRDQRNKQGGGQRNNNQGGNKGRRQNNKGGNQQRNKGGRR
ncbi:hypothetical protein DL89DRAFT_221993 [Linderina pennispora]|uniref:Eukaryotic translation initiation factor 3 subunit C n=1 Tax=Linderina pennispora TaxID=61395 RepID=A0A1Y1WCK7_9FUNG|nr:uncharacterized protein DL89DRAFT_221993 [Linderina pennispora]ORX71172.1 hypothetical protein DL89DRAFT_221993 [Linderina pennispora]